LPADGLDPIVEAAAMLFETRGYDETTMGQVAERAGVGRQTVHARYGGKSGLLAAIVVEFCGGFVRHVLRSGADTDSGSRLQDHPTGLAQLVVAAHVG
jgi:AcrR family transcriptional regulator